MQKDISLFKRQYAFVISVFICYLISGFCNQPLGSMMPFIRDGYKLDYSFVGTLVSLMSVGNLLGNFLFSFIQYKLGRRASILILSAGMTLCYLVLVARINVKIILAIAFLVSGFARGAISTFSSTMVSTLEGDVKAKAYNVQHALFSIGAFVGIIFLLFCTKYDPAKGWRIFSAVALALSLVVLFKYATMSIPVADGLKKAPSHSATSEGSKDVDKSSGKKLGFLKDPRFWMSGFILLTYISVEYSIFGWLVTYFVDSGIFSINISQLLNGTFWLVMFFGRMFSAYIIKKVRIDVYLMLNSLLVVACFVLMMTCEIKEVVIGSLMLSAFCMSPIYPNAYSIGSQVVAGSDIGNSILTFIGSIGGIVTPFIIGLVAEKHSINSAIVVIVMATVLMFASTLIYFIKNLKRK